MEIVFLILREVLLQVHEKIHIQVIAVRGLIVEHFEDGDFLAGIVRLEELDIEWFQHCNCLLVDYQFLQRTNSQANLDAIIGESVLKHMGFSLEVVSVASKRIRVNVVHDTSKRDQAVASAKLELHILDVANQ